MTATAAVQAVRHRSETVATLAWITGYAVPLLIRGASGGAGAATHLRRVTLDHAAAVAADPSMSAGRRGGHRL